jgi:hypothetical protein
MGAHATLELSHRGRAILRCRRRHGDDKGLPLFSGDRCTAGQGVDGRRPRCGAKSAIAISATWLRCGGPRQAADSHIAHRTGRPERPPPGQRVADLIDWWSTIDGAGRGLIVHQSPRRRCGRRPQRRPGGVMSARHPAAHRADVVGRARPAIR